MISKYKGVLLMISAALFFGAGNLFVKLASTQISSWETVFYRGAGGLLLAFIITRIKYRSFKIVDKKRLILRGLIGALSVSCFFYGIKHGNVTTATMLTYTFPIFGSIFTSLVYKEHPIRFFWFFLAVAIGGIVIILNPSTGSIKVADIVALCGGLLAGVAVSLVRRLRHTDKPETVFAAFMLFTMFLSSPFAIPKLSIYSGNTWLALTLMVLSTSLAQIQMTKAYHSLKVSTGGIIQLLTVFFTAIFAVFHGDKITFRIILGGLLILGASAAILLLQNYQRNRRR